VASLNWKTRSPYQTKVLKFSARLVTAGIKAVIANSQAEKISKAARRYEFGLPEWLGVMEP
jgi:hypothetical protein